MKNTHELQTVKQSPEEIFIHDDWNHLTTDYDADISLLRFVDGSITFDAFVQPICLWESDVEPNVTDAIVIGWGRSENPTSFHENIPKRVKAIIETNEQCFLRAKALIDLSSFRTFCAGLRNGSGVCSGDSGGGLFIKIDGIYHLKGIVSSSLIKDGNCDVTRNAVFTNVFKFKDWVNEIIRKQTSSADQSTAESTQSSAILVASKIPISMHPKPTITSTQRTTQVITFNNFFKKVSCTFEIMGFWKYSKLNTCIVNEIIDSESYVIESPSTTTVHQFYIPDNKEAKFLPMKIGKRFPHLKELWVRNCGLSIVRSFNFKHMQKLQCLVLSNNEIKVVETNAFKDLVSLLWLNLAGNMIETLDHNAFKTMVNLRWIYLSHNKIKFLSPQTFIISEGKLMHVGLIGNQCINDNYDLKIGRLVDELSYKCGVIFL